MLFLQDVLEYICTKILVSLLKTQQGNQFVVMVMNCYMKLIKAIPTTRPHSTAVAHALLWNWVTYYAISSNLLIDRGPELLSYFFWRFIALYCE